MEKFKIFMLLVLVTLGTAVFASDDTKTTKENVKENPKEQCQDLTTTQLVNVQVRFTDCPDYLCEVKNCQLAICIYDYTLTLISCKLFDPATCTYDFTRVSAEVNQTVYARLVKASGGDPCVFNTGFAQTAGTITPGISDYTIDTQLCQ